MLYLDTSVLVPLVVPEEMSPVVERWFADAAPDLLASSRWAEVELASAIGIKVRRGDLTADEGSAVLATLAAQVMPAIRLVPVEKDDFSTAAGLMRGFDLGLRAGDALHLAIASRVGATLVTLDRKLAEAARSTGLGVEAFSRAP